MSTTENERRIDIPVKLADVNVVFSASPMSA